MNQRSKDFVRALERLGATEIRIVPGGKHPKVMFVFKGKSYWHIAPSGKSASRFWLDKAIADVRRQLGLNRRRRRPGQRVSVFRASNEATKSNVPCPRVTPGKDPWATLKWHPLYREAA